MFIVIDVWLHRVIEEVAPAQVALFPNVLFIGFIC